jgi:hypothetical protein
MNVHLVRLDIAREDPAANRARVGQLVDRASPAAGDRALLPETQGDCAIVGNLA